MPFRAAQQVCAVNKVDFSTDARKFSGQNFQIHIGQEKPATSA
jgi:hypothetical protein